MPESRRLVFFDTVTLSNFALAGRLDLLVERYGPNGFVTTEVQDELADGVCAGFGALREIDELVARGALGNATLTDEERKLFRELLSVLSAGEASCIACAKTRKAVVATDDRAARTCCTERDVHFTGSIGILKACCRDNMLTPTEADSVLVAMVEQGFYAPVRRISDLL